MRGSESDKAPPHLSVSSYLLLVVMLIIVLYHPLLSQSIAGRVVVGGWYGEKASVF